MKRFALALTIAIAALPVVTLARSPLPAAAQTTLPPEPASLGVTGDATVRREPDEATASVEIVTNDDDPAISAGKNTTILGALQTKLAALGVAGDAIGTTNFYVNFVPHPPKNLPPEDRQPRYGYVTSRSVTVRVSPIGRIGKVVDAALAAGVTQIDGVAFELKDRKAIYRQALAAALADAKATASALAASGDFRIVRIRHIATTGYPSPIRPLQTFARASLAPNFAPTPPPTEIVPNGPIEVSAHVDVTYEIR